jgi:ribose transport system permease protein
MCLRHHHGGIRPFRGLHGGGWAAWWQALLAPYGSCPGPSRGLAAGLAWRVQPPSIITRLNILPFITYRSPPMLRRAAAALLLAGNQSVSVSYESGFDGTGQG